MAVVGGNEDLLVPSVSRTEMSWSSFVHPQGPDAVVAQVFRAVTGRRFTVPLRVTMNRKRSFSSSMSRVWIMV